MSHNNYAAQRNCVNLSSWFFFHLFRLPWNLSFRCDKKSIILPSLTSRFFSFIRSEKETEQKLLRTRGRFVKVLQLWFYKPNFLLTYNKLFQTLVFLTHRRCLAFCNIWPPLWTEFTLQHGSRINPSEGRTLFMSKRRLPGDESIYVRAQHFRPNRRQPLKTELPRSSEFLQA
jgi:hypothetical protein